MTGFDETVPPDLDPDADATSAQDVGDNVIAPEGGPVPGHAVDDDEHGSSATSASRAATEGTT